MEIMLAIVVVAAVIFFGALISMGNERQRRAIDNLREQVVLWAMWDLRIKREKLAHDVKIDNPTGWLNNIASNVCGYNLKLQILESFDEPPSMICAAGDGTRKIIFSPISPAGIRSIKRGKHNRLAQFADRNPLLALPRGVNVHELSTLNGGLLFDLELAMVWKNITGWKLDSVERLWMYEYS